jgi:hypothetical protein
MANLSNKIPPLGVAVNESPTFTGGITVTGTVAATDFTGDGTTLTGVATITGTETLTNKTLDTPAVTGNITQQAADLGALVNDSVENLSLRSDTANDDRLAFTAERLSAGTTWASAAHRVQRTVNGGKFGYIQFGDSPEFISFGQGTVEYTRINNAGAFLHGQPTDGVAGYGDIVMSGGLYVGQANAANYLDDYEEGTWTAIVRDSAGNLATMTNADGVYTKVGNLVTVYVDAQTSSIGSMTTNVRIYGLPFAVALDNGTVNIGHGVNLNAGAGNTVTGLASFNATYLELFVWSLSTGTTQLTPAEWSANGRVFLSATYYAA